MSDETSAEPPALGLAPPPDVQTIPAPPTLFTTYPLHQFRGRYPRAGQISAVPDAVAELSASTTYETTLGASAPSRARFIAQLTTAAAWTHVRTAVERYLHYAKVQEGLAWSDVLPQMVLAKTVFDLAQRTNPETASSFPALKRLLSIQATIAQRAGTTRRKRQKEKDESP